MSERLELVTDFGTIRATDLLVERTGHCRRCYANEHRYMAVALIHGVSFFGDDGEVRSGSMWEVLPVPQCWSGRKYGVAHESVAQGRIWRVLIPPAAETRATTRARKLERVE